MLRIETSYPRMIGRVVHLQVTLKFDDNSVVIKATMDVESRHVIICSKDTGIYFGEKTQARIKNEVTMSARMFYESSR